MGEIVPMRMIPLVITDALVQEIAQEVREETAKGAEHQKCRGDIEPQPFAQYEEYQLSGQKMLEHNLYDIIAS